jgi:hypothetical protein
MINTRAFHVTSAASPAGEKSQFISYEVICHGGGHFVFLLSEIYVDVISFVLFSDY